MATIRRRAPGVLVTLVLAAGLTPTSGPVADAATAQTDLARRPVAVMALGDSITLGGTYRELRTPGGYRGYLDTDLRDAGLSHTFVGTSLRNPPLAGLLNPTRFAHDGWSGARVDELATALFRHSPLDGGRWLTGTATRDAIEPDVVVLLAGTNDIHQHWDPGTHYPGGYTPRDAQERGLFVQHLGQRLEAMVVKMHHHDRSIRFVVCTIPRTQGPVGAPYNAAIKHDVVPDLARAGIQVRVADVARSLRGIPLSPDHVHPTPNGYRAAARTISRSVVTLMRR